MIKNKFLKKKTKRSESKLEDKINENLLGSKFRILNEKLYTIPSDEALEYFKNNPEDFEIYHQGFTIQASKWPVNPNILIIQELERHIYSNKVIADLGCGEGLLAKKLKDRKVYSFDLVKYNHFITQCDIKNVPLKNSECDIAIFCLSLMGTNFIDFIKESYRILKPGGILIVAEITSRIISLKKFVSIFHSLDFNLRKRKNIKNYFTLFVFRKGSINNVTNSITKHIESEVLKPCLYKKR